MADSNTWQDMATAKKNYFDHRLIFGRVLGEYRVVVGHWYLDEWRPLYSQDISIEAILWQPIPEVHDSWKKIIETPSE